MRYNCLPLLFSILLAYPAPNCSATPAHLVKMLKNGGLRVEDSDGRVLLRHRDTESFIPASTMKIVTSFCALERLGRDFRFRTEFLISRPPQESTTLYVRGSGDPGLVSEEFEVIAKHLSERIERVDKIVIDTSLFEDDIEIDGMSLSTNPYDARNAAFVGNYSSALVRKSRAGKVTSAEALTPLTKISEAAGSRLPPGVTERVNLGKDWRRGALYGGELLAEFLSMYGVRGALLPTLGRIPVSATRLYLHESTATLATTVEGLLRYSTNFTANQLFLLLGIEEFGAPATVDKGQKALAHCVSSKIGLRNFHIEEGSGLSRLTKFTPAQMTMVLLKFQPYKDLLHEQDGFLAKTGTLTGVNSLAGYYSIPKKGEIRFAILINSPVPPLYKYTVAKEIVRYLNP